MLTKFGQYIKSHGVYFFLGLLFVVAGCVYWAAKIVPVNYRVVFNSTNLPKLALYSLILPILILLSTKRDAKRSSQRQNFITFIKQPLSDALIADVGIFLILFFISWGIVSAINSSFDRSPAHIYKVKVTSKKISYFRGISKNYELKVKPWFDRKADYTIDLSRSEYEHLNVISGDLIYVGIGKGALGLDWITSISKEETTTNDREQNRTQ